jgi:hypothetical protein
MLRQEKIGASLTVTLLRLQQQSVMPLRQVRKCLRFSSEPFLNEGKNPVEVGSNSYSDGIRNLSDSHVCLVSVTILPDESLKVQHALMEVFACKFCWRVTGEDRDD